MRLSGYLTSNAKKPCNWPRLCLVQIAASKVEENGNQTERSASSVTRQHYYLLDVQHGFIDLLCTTSTMGYTRCPLESIVKYCCEMREHHLINVYWVKFQHQTKAAENNLIGEIDIDSCFQYQRLIITKILSISLHKIFISYLENQLKKLAVATGR